MGGSDYCCHCGEKRDGTCSFLLKLPMQLKEEEPSPQPVAADSFTKAWSSDLSYPVDKMSALSGVVIEMVRGLHLL